MIRYHFSESELIADFTSHDKKKGRKEAWLKKAKRLTKELSGKLNSKKEIPSKWSEIKEIYTVKQHQKCIYCEKLLGPHELSAVEVDVEHFRPKNAVKAWPTPALRKELKLPADFPQSTGSGKGYRALAFHYFNYASSCKTCNSRLKANYFPIAGKHDFNGTDPVALCKKEKPYLVYPLGDFDEDPEKIIAFNGFVAVPAFKPATKHNYNRGRVTITFFRLNEIRDDLLLLRAKQLDNILTKLELLPHQKSIDAKRATWNDIQLLASEKNDHAGCVRHLLRRYGSPLKTPAPATRAEAVTDLKLARDYVRSKLKP